MVPPEMPVTVVTDGPGMPPEGAGICAQPSPGPARAPIRTPMPTASPFATFPFRWSLVPSVAIARPSCLLILPG
jgi:hypothetical protein